MPDVDGLVEILDLEALDLNLFRGKQPETVLQRVFGGQVAAQALVAAVRTAPTDRSVHSLHSYFLRPGDPNVPIIYDVDPLRDGRSFSTRRVLARQHGNPIYVMTANLQIDERGFEHQDAMPAAPPPEDCPDLGELHRVSGDEYAAEWAKDWAALELRDAGDPRPGDSIEDHPARIQYWVKVAGRLPEDPTVHQAALTYLSDLTLIRTSLLPHRSREGDPQVQAASLDHTIWFHRRFCADDWLLYVQSSPSASGARGLIFGELFTQDGTLAASVAQEGLIRPRS